MLNSTSCGVEGSMVIRGLKEAKEVVNFRWSECGGPWEQGGGGGGGGGGDSEKHG